jgi:hypothetical protein
MKSMRGTPVEVALAATIVAYLLSAVVLRDFGSPEAAATLLRFPVVLIAFITTIVAYTVLWFCITPRIRKSCTPAAEEPIEIVAAHHNASRDALAAASRWWHYVLAGTGGLIFGLLLARGLLLTVGSHV